MWHIWTLDDWEKNIDLERSGHRCGLRLRFDKEVDSEVRRACKEFAVFLRREYFFPIRVVIYVKARERIIAMDGDKCCGIFWCMPDDYTIEPYIRLAAGDYEKLCKKCVNSCAIHSSIFVSAPSFPHFLHNFS